MFNIQDIDTGLMQTLYEDQTNWVTPEGRRFIMVRDRKQNVAHQQSDAK